MDVHTRAAEERLRLVLGTRVRIVRQGERGRIEIDFGSEDELIRLFEQLTERGLSTAADAGRDGHACEQVAGTRKLCNGVELLRVP